MITFRQKGDFSKLTRFLERAKESVRLGDLDKYGREGVAALASATPVDTRFRIDQLLQHKYSKWSPYCSYFAVRTCNKKRRLGTGERLHQSCYPAYF